MELSGLGVGWDRLGAGRELSGLGGSWVLDGVDWELSGVCRESGGRGELGGGG